MKIGNRVARKDAPEVQGTVIAIQDGKAKVYWSSHISQWIDTAALMLARKTPRVTEKAKR